MGLGPHIRTLPTRSCCAAPGLEEFELVEATVRSE